MADLPALGRLVLAYAPRRHALLFETLCAFDHQLGQIVRTTNEPLIGQMRFQWWHDVINQPADQRPRGNPLVASLAVLEASRADTRDALLSMIEGWERLLPGNELTPAELADYAQQRGAALFGLVSQTVGAGDPGWAAAHGRFWALWDLARHCSDARLLEHLTDTLARDRQHLPKGQPPRALRPLSILSRLAQADARTGDYDRPLLRPATAFRVIGHGLTGW